MNNILGHFAWEDWIKGILTGFIGGGAGAVGSAFSAGLIVPGHFTIGSAEFFKMVFYAFIMQGTLTMFAYLHQKPIPDKVQETILKTTEISGLPKIVETSVKTTEVLPPAETKPAPANPN